MRYLHPREFFEQARQRSAYVAAALLLLSAGVFGVFRLYAHADPAALSLADSVADSASADSSVLLPPKADAVARVPSPDAVRALYLNAWAAGSPTKLPRLIDIANRTEINSFVIDVKEGGEVSYRTGVRLANEIGAAQTYIRDVRALLTRLRENNIYPIARIVVFKDPVLAKAKPEYAVKNADGSIWLDNKGKAWVDSYNRDVWDYNIALAREAIELGFSEVQWDYVRFPDAPRSYLSRAVWPAQQGRSKSDAIREFLLYARERLKDLNVPVTADVFGLTVTTTGDMGIGQQWEKMVDAVDVILPMVYPSHFIPGNYGLSNPNAAPYRTIRRAMDDAIKRTSPVPNAARIRPWLQDFTLGPPRYGAAHVRAQIEAVHDAGLTEWVLWHPGSNYTIDALTVDGQPAPHFDIPGGKGPPEKPVTREKGSGREQP